MSNSTFNLQPSTVLLYGPSGSGKSTIGRLLAENLNLSFVDLDVEIEARSGMLVPEIFASQGEARFREWERTTLELILASDEQVIALGGGALTVPETRQLAERAGDVILLHAAPDALLARLQADDDPRPLLAPSPLAPLPEGEVKASAEKLESMLARRSGHYESFERKLDTTHLSPEESTWELQIKLGRYHLKAMSPAYDVRVQPGGLDELGVLMQARGLNGPVAVVTDENVGGLYLPRVLESLQKSGYEARGITIPAGETYKTLETVSQLWDGFLSAKIERRSTVVGLGGGVVGDLAGFAAATFLRGVPWVAVPTSLLAMVDASMGGKTGADLPQGKNLIGAFHPPRLVLADPEVLATLPEEELRSGMGEVVKHGVIADAKLFEICRNFRGLTDLGGLLVSRAMAVKIRVIEQDPFERGIRAALNLGHTIGHAVELVSGFELRHGEAVAIGTVAEARLAEQIGLAESGLANKIAAVLQAVGLPTEIPPELDRDALIHAMQYDKKKSGGAVKFALPAAIGDVRVGIEAADMGIAQVIARCTTMERG
ncbi:MAG: 3-dehydroquinate synthase [Chloroflexi bacterium]|jgi:shikimate kinase / 3-dehydroquinate synthase|nr:3-dehydroquinate synthase [Chloroflexota bacterium]